MKPKKLGLVKKSNLDKLIIKITNILVAHKKFLLLKLNLLNKKEKETAKNRMEICNRCQSFNKSKKQCNLCGCNMIKKILVMNEYCPQRKW